ncbi:Esterase YbfF [Thalassovita gelatinovora]|uniref:Esterase YbfF n=1 Tax=Thalassovita gelatinovora TaxID=53501 RepID=A0A0P1F7L6_THAGE|nr:alpha/beta fold hydrolase [Thalassovita gelatinovora]QIZ80192.1 alpha/beta fold hydrolase [Thalassovita gelatinovora]CUH64015.1 Esterase YbfF [Thalassovita gelatinovora]SEQ81652.1 Pimeloyl-ACP methyl ester carboxylesterase [Thalassovita gelatinovora]
MLNQIVHGEKTDRPSLLIVHGLYGSGRNWGVIAKRLSDGRQVIAVDQRNHGFSPWHDSHSYEDMAEDLARVIRAQGGPMDVLGHSMGGKAAMVLALKYPNLVNRLIVADIAPVAYGHSQLQYIEAMRAVDLDKVEKRSDAEAQLRDLVDDPILPTFFTQSLDVAQKRWRLNHDALEQDMEKILSFPDLDGQFGGPTLFLSGAKSDYVKREDRPHIKALFPQAKFAKIPDTGHWLHAEKPREFEAAVRAYLT